jgi:cytidylate kinase
MLAMSDLTLKSPVHRQQTSSTTSTTVTTPLTATVPSTTTQTTSPTAESTTSAPVAALFQAGDPPVGQRGRQPGSMRPLEALMSAKLAQKPVHQSFAAAFTSVVGATALNDLKSAMGNKPIVLIAGDQCTGKGTAAEGLVASLGGGNTGTGTVLRALAKENNLSIEQMSAMLSGKAVDVVGTDGVSRPMSLKDFPHLGTAEDVDVRLDFRAAKAIAGSELKKADGSSVDITVFESRLAGHLGQFLEGIGRENIVSVYLYAAPRVQAERYLEREVFIPADKAATTGAARAAVVDARQKAKAVLAGLTDQVGLGDCLQKLVDANIPGLDSMAAKVKGIAGRDENDKSRLLSLYGVDYQDRSAFDVVVDTNGRSPDQVKAAILEAVTKKTASTST